MDIEDPGPEGHRARLRQRLLIGGPDALLDHELVECLLGLAIRRQDTKPLARTLLDHFGDLAQLLSAEPEALAQVKGIGEVAIAALKITQASAVRLLRVEASRRPVLGGWQALLDYLHADMAHGPVERFRVLHLNARNMLIRDDLMAEGTIDEAPVYVRDVVRRSLQLGTSSLILVHNHPSGDPQPSRADIAITRSLADAAKLLGISVHDHVIVAASGHSSLRSLGLM